MGFVECVGFGELFEVTGIIFQKVVHERFPFGCEAAAMGPRKEPAPMEAAVRRER